MGEFVEALRRSLETRKVSYRRLAEMLTEAGLPRNKDTVALWVNGRQPMWPEEVFAVERVLGLKPGSLSREIGYLPTDAVAAKTIEELVMADPLLDDRAKDMILASYEAATRRAQRRKSGSA